MTSEDGGGVCKILTDTPLIEMFNFKSMLLNNGAHTVYQIDSRARIISSNPALFGFILIEPQSLKPSGYLNSPTKQLVSFKTVLSFLNWYFSTHSSAQVRFNERRYSLLVYLDYSPDRANCSNCHNNGGADLKQVYDRRAVTPFYAKYDEYLRSNPRFRLTTGNIQSILPQFAAGIETLLRPHCEKTVISRNTIMRDSRSAWSTFLKELRDPLFSPPAVREIRIYYEIVD